MFKPKKYKILTLFFLLLFIITFWRIENISNATTSKLSELTTGTSIMFGSKLFRVVDPNTGLVVSQNIINSMAFDNDLTNVYNPADFNNVGYFLNNDYLNTFTATQQSKIKNSTWYTGNDSDESATELNAKIGLLRVSEYKKVRSILSQTEPGKIFPSDGECVCWWTITSSSINPDEVLHVHVDGSFNDISADILYGVRPAFQIYKFTIFTYDECSRIYYEGSGTKPAETVSGLTIGNTVMFANTAYKIVNPATGLMVLDYAIKTHPFDTLDNQVFKTLDPTNIGYYLNNDYYNTLTLDQKALIKNATWYIGNETNESASSVTAKIGLLRYSDYANLKGNNFPIEEGKIFPTIGQSGFWWTITPNYQNNSSVFFVRLSGLLGMDKPPSSYLGVRPALQILESTIVESIEGQQGVYRIVPINNTNNFANKIYVNKNCGLIKVKNVRDVLFGSSYQQDDIIEIIPLNPSNFYEEPSIDAQGYLSFNPKLDFSGLIQCETKLWEDNTKTIPPKKSGILFIDVFDSFEMVPLTEVIFNNKLNEIILKLQVPLIPQNEVLSNISDYNKLLDEAPSGLMIDSLSKISNTINTYQNIYLQDENIIFELRNTGSKIIELMSKVVVPSSIYNGKIGVVLGPTKEQQIDTKVAENLAVARQINKIFLDLNLLDRFETMMFLKIKEKLNGDNSFIELPYDVFRKMYSKGIENIVLQTSNATICLKRNSIWDNGVKTIFFESKDITSSIITSPNILKKYDLSLYLDGVKVTSLKDNASIHIQLPYNSSINVQNLTAKRENADSTLSNIGGMYNKSFERMVFITNHFSVYYIYNIDNSFTDLDEVSWASDYISGLAARGVVNGMGDNNFLPNNFIKKEEMISMVVKSFNLMDLEAVSSFTDVDKSDWFYPSVSSGLKKGIVLGYNKSIFGVGDFVTRQDGATILANCLLKTKMLTYPNNSKDIVSKYLDNASIKKYAIPSIALLTVQNIVKGDPTGNFLPLNYFTRAQFASALYLTTKLQLSQGLPYAFYEEFIDVS